MAKNQFAPAEVVNINRQEVVSLLWRGLLFLSGLSTSALAMDYVEQADLFNDDYDKNGEWNDQWECSPSCFQVFASIRKTRYKDDKEFDRTISEAPPILRPHLISRRLIN